MSSRPSNPGKSALRERARQARQSLSKESRLTQDQCINQGILELVRTAGAGKIAAYLAFDGEPGIEASLTELAGSGVEVFLPVLVGKPPSGVFEFRHWIGPGANGATELATNAFGIREPSQGAPCETADLDLMFMPLVAWDESGNRIGMGGGYYDRVLAAFAHEPGGPRRVGVAYQIQKVERIPASPHDVRLHQIVTEDGLFTFST